MKHAGRNYHNITGWNNHCFAIANRADIGRANQFSDKWAGWRKLPNTLTVAPSLQNSRSREHIADFRDVTMRQSGDALTLISLSALSPEYAHSHVYIIPMSTTRTCWSGILPSPWYAAIISDTGMWVAYSVVWATVTSVNWNRNRNAINPLRFELNNFFSWLF